ncbi:carboxymuconolactone decarboxylase family protein [Knoellia locipacati]|uniref:hypothetical protein n=1 Tax=Knoellia locipacati TaxID=882824 RepID=UPI00384B1023
MFITRLETDAADDELRTWYESQQAMWGFLPDYAGAFSHRPDVAQAWGALNHTIRGGMDRRRFEIATIAAARARRSTVCTVAHSTFLGAQADPETAATFPPEQLESMLVGRPVATP